VAWLQTQKTNEVDVGKAAVAATDKQ